MTLRLSRGVQDFGNKYSFAKGREFAEVFCVVRAMQRHTGPTVCVGSECWTISHLLPLTTLTICKEVEGCFHDKSVLDWFEWASRRIGNAGANLVYRNRIGIHRSHSSSLVGGLRYGEPLQRVNGTERRKKVVDVHRWEYNNRKLIRRGCGNVAIYNLQSGTSFVEGSLLFHFSALFREKIFRICSDIFVTRKIKIMRELRVGQGNNTYPEVTDRRVTLLSNSDVH